MRIRLLAIAASALVAAAAPAAPTSAQRTSAPLVAAKHCPSGYPRARTPDGNIKCLHAGERCVRARSWQRVYRRHGFHCDRDRRLRER